MVMMVCLPQPVSPASRSVSWVMVAGESSQSRFISFHSPSESRMCAIVLVLLSFGRQLFTFAFSIADR